MKIVEIELGKELTFSPVQYENVKPFLRMKIQLGENEEPDFVYLWDLINRELFIETDLDHRWIKAKDTKDHWKYILKIRKRKK